MSESLNRADSPNVGDVNSFMLRQGIHPDTYPLRDQLLMFRDECVADLSSRLAEAEAIIDHYADERRWLKAVMSDGNETVGRVRYYGMPDNGYDKAREYRKKYPKGENL